MTELNESQRGVLLSAMSPASAAFVLGRSVRWVDARREELRADQGQAYLTEPKASAPPREPKPAPTVDVQPVTRPVLRWCRWFVDAGWSVAETAELFDLDGRTLGAALRRPA